MGHRHGRSPSVGVGTTHAVVRRGSAGEGRVVQEEVLVVQYELALTGPRCNVLHSEQHGVVLFVVATRVKKEDPVRSDEMRHRPARAEANRGLNDAITLLHRPIVPLLQRQRTERGLVASPSPPPLLQAIHVPARVLAGRGVYLHLPYEFKPPCDCPKDVVLPQFLGHRVDETAAATPPPPSLTARERWPPPSCRRTDLA